MNEATERQVWQEPDYEGMIPKLEEAHIEINQLRYKIKKGGLELKDPVKDSNEINSHEITERETGAILGMLIQEGNKRLQELSDIKSYLKAVKEEGMLKVKSGYVGGFKWNNINSKTDNSFIYLWSPSGIKADSFIMKGDEVGTKKDKFIAEKNHEEIEDSMLLSIDFGQIEKLLRQDKISA